MGLIKSKQIEKQYKNEIFKKYKASFDIKAYVQNILEEQPGVFMKLRYETSNEYFCVTILGQQHISISCYEKHLKLSDVEEEDIIITGSIASYNWHDKSDIDLHILYDFSKINEDVELVKKMLDQTRINWNKKQVPCKNKAPYKRIACKS